MHKNVKQSKRRTARRWQYCHLHVIKPVVRVTQRVPPETWWIAQGRRGRDIFEPKRLNKGWCVNIWKQRGTWNWKLYLESTHNCTTCCVQSDEVSKHDSCWLLNGQLGSARPRVRQTSKCVSLYLDTALKGCKVVKQVHWPIIVGIVLGCRVALPRPCYHPEMSFTWNTPRSLLN